GKIDKDTYIICNGFKRPLYTQYISEMVNEDFNLIPVLDNMKELQCYEEQIKKPVNVGIRIASEEAPEFNFYTSRLGIRHSDIIPFYKEKIKDNPKFNLKMLHFFINTGISDSAYYWSELSKCLKVFVALKKICPTLDSLNIGGGFPIKTSLAFDFDYQYMVNEIIRHVKEVCDEHGFAHPDVFTEFGSFTVGESGAIFYSILDQKQQNDRELWYMIDGSFITHLPDIWGIDKKFILLAVNQWDKPYIDVNLGGLTCDSMDYYNQESHVKKVFLPKITNGDKLFIGFFHTGAYQESIGGLGGIQHCLIPAAQHLVLDLDDKGELREYLFMDEQTSEHMLKTLGY
ncbi:MAG: arginine decarboxylase, partial [Bacteroidetes bacterium]